MRIPISLPAPPHPPKVTPKNKIKREREKKNTSDYNTEKYGRYGRKGEGEKGLTEKVVFWPRLENED